MTKWGISFAFSKFHRIYFLFFRFFLLFRISLSSSFSLYASFFSFIPLHWIDSHHIYFYLFYFSKLLMVSDIFSVSCRCVCRFFSYSIFLFPIKSLGLNEPRATKDTNIKKSIKLIVQLFFFLSVHSVSLGCCYQFG